MLTITDRIKALCELGEWMLDYTHRWPRFNNEYEQLLMTCIRDRFIHNPYHTEPQVMKALTLWANKLSYSSIKSFVDGYSELVPIRATHVASIPRDNVPLSGIDDLVCILLAGHHYYCRNLNHEHDLMELLTKQLIIIEPKLSETIHWCSGFPKFVNAYLVSVKTENATFSQYLHKRQSLIREQRVSVAIIRPEDSRKDYTLLGNDIFNFFGRSSYNVRKIYVPEQFSFKDFFESVENFSFVSLHNRYANNYDYQKSVLLMEREPILDNGFIILQESVKMMAPIGCLYYEYYKNLDEVMMKLNVEKNQIQQIVTNFDVLNSVKCGAAFDNPLWNFEDQKDTMRFLMNLEEIGR